MLTLYIGIVLLLILINGFFAMAEIALISIRVDETGRGPRGSRPGSSCYWPWAAATRSGRSRAAFGVPRPVTGSQPGVAG